LAQQSPFLIRVYSRLFAADFSFICVYQRSSAAELLWPIAICAICQLLAAFLGNISPQ
jgi:hypothetical protein